MGGKGGGGEGEGTGRGGDGEGREGGKVRVHIGTSFFPLLEPWLCPLLGTY